MANIALLNDLVQFEFEGELLRMMSLTMIVNNTPVKLINVEMATDFLKPFDVTMYVLESN